MSKDPFATNYWHAVPADVIRLRRRHWNPDPALHAGENDADIKAWERDMAAGFPVPYAITMPHRIGRPDYGAVWPWNPQAAPKLKTYTAQILAWVDGDLTEHETAWTKPVTFKGGNRRLLEVRNATVKRPAAGADYRTLEDGVLPYEPDRGLAGFALLPNCPITIREAELVAERIDAMIANYEKDGPAPAEVATLL